MKHQPPHPVQAPSYLCVHAHECRYTQMHVHALCAVCVQERVPRVQVAVREQSQVSSVLTFHLA